MTSSRDPGRVTACRSGSPMTSTAPSAASSCVSSRSLRSSPSNGDKPARDSSPAPTSTERSPIRRWRRSSTPAPAGPSSMASMSTSLPTRPRARPNSTSAISSSRNSTSFTTRSRSPLSASANTSRYGSPPSQLTVQSSKSRFPSLAITWATPIAYPHRRGSPSASSALSSAPKMYSTAPKPRWSAPMRLDRRSWSSSMDVSAMRSSISSSATGQRTAAHDLRSITGPTQMASVRPQLWRTAVNASRASVSEAASNEVHNPSTAASKPAPSAWNC